MKCALRAIQPLAPAASLDSGGSPDFSNATAEGRVFLTSVLPLLDDPCHAMTARQKSVELSIAASAMPQNLLMEGDLDAFIGSTALPQLANLEQTSQLLTQLISYVANAAPFKTSNITVGAHNRSAACNCTDASCSASFLPGFYDLPVDSWGRNFPQWTCDVASSAQTFPMELLNMNTSGFLRSLGLPKVCAEFFLPIQTLNGKDAFVGEIIARPGDMFQFYPPFCTDSGKGCLWNRSLMQYDYESYFEQCRPHVCSYMVQTDLFSNAWLFFMITVSALHVELELLKLLTGPLVDGVASLLGLFFKSSPLSSDSDLAHLEEDEKPGLIEVPLLHRF